MANKSVRVPIHRTTPTQTVSVEVGATKGAQIGVDLLLDDGTLATTAKLKALFGSGTSTGSTAGPDTTDELDEGQFNLYFTNLRAQDAVGGILVDTATIDFAYVNGTSITATLKDLADSGTGAALVKITRDAQGRISGTSSATTDDLAEGATNLWYTDARADARITAQKGVANGLAPLESDGKISVTYLPAAVLGQVSYQGTWDASAGTPPTATPDKGWYYIVTVAGSTDLDGITDWKVGDWAIYNGTTWDKVDNTDAVVTVNGYTGAVTLTYTDVGAASSAQGAKADTALQSVVAGTNVTVDNTDPLNPVINATGGGGTGDVVGPGSAVDGNVALFDGATGKLIKDGGTFGSLVRAAVLTGLSLATSTVIAATDTVLDAFGKLQAQINGKAPSTQIGTYASRPAASAAAGVIYYATDVQEAYRSDGSTWTVIPCGGTEIGYAEITSTTTTTSATAVDIAGLSVTCKVGERPVILSYGGAVRNSLTGAFIRIQAVANGFNTSNITVPGTGNYLTQTRETRVSGLTPGNTYTFKLQILAIGGGTAYLYGDAYDRPYFQVRTT